MPEVPEVPEMPEVPEVPEVPNYRYLHRGHLHLYDFRILRPHLQAASGTWIE